MAKKPVKKAKKVYCIAKKVKKLINRGHREDIPKCPRLFITVKGYLK
jgi:hypothetical protein